MPKKSRVEYFKENFGNFSIPIPWDCYVAVLERCYGFEMSNSPGGGSARIFVCEEIRFIAHEPHGRDDMVSKWDRKRAIEAIERMKGEKS